MTKKEKAFVARNNKIIGKFMGKNYRDSLNYMYDLKWDALMPVVDKIESIIGHAVHIDNCIDLSWWYSPSKVTRFQKGFGGGGGGTEPRNPFDCIGGKLYGIEVYYTDIQFKISEKKNQYKMKNKLEATWLACTKFIEWYNKNVKK